MLILFTSTIFLSALLLFMVQPMAARAILPLLGGSPSVWNTSMVFFQALLLGGYIYAHALARMNKGTRQLAIHVVVIGLAACFLPIALPSGLVPPTDSGQTLWLLGVLGLMIAAPFFLLATTGPLVQSWFARTGHKSAKDPYFLYAASNVGSFVGLLGYPIVVDPLLGLRDQGIMWAIGFGALVPLLIGCAIVMVRAGRVPDAASDHAPKADAASVNQGTGAGTGLAAIAAPIGRTRLWWIFLAFVPSSLVLGTTQFLSTDIAAIPLMWVIPLSIYLLSFVIAFSGRVSIPERVLGKAYAYLAVALTAAFLLRGRDPIILLILLHLVALFVGATLCHTRLAATRPHPSRLTEFYLWIAVGGVLGGIFNALLAPVLFNDVLEYPLAIALVGLAIASQQSAAERGTGPARQRQRLLDLGVPVLAAALVLVLGWVADSMPRGSGEREITSALRVGLPCILCFVASASPLRFTLTIALTLIVSSLAGEPGGRTVHQERTFFGVLRVLQDGESRTLRHGTTAHGMQLFTPEHQRTPLVYYHPDGPLGDVMRVIQPGPSSPTESPAPAISAPAIGAPAIGPPAIGAIGMGVGAVAAYTLPGQQLTFYEIDPAIDRIARDPELFTFVRDSRGSISTVIGDGRLAIAKTPDHRYGLIILDAFSSDAIPVHLITKEAVALYRSKLTVSGEGDTQRGGPGGIIAFHVSNVHIDLVPPLAGIARELGLAMLVCTDLAADGTPDRPWPSVWVVMAESPETLAPFTRRSTTGPVRLLWQPHDPGGSTLPVWTDDHANILAMFKW